MVQAELIANRIEKGEIVLKLKWPIDNLNIIERNGKQYIDILFTDKVVNEAIDILFTDKVVNEAIEEVRRENKGGMI